MRKLYILKEILWDIGIPTYLIGVYKKYRNKKFIKEFDIPKWHIYPLELKIYALNIVKYVNKKKYENVYEIGCGLGDIISNIHCNKRIGIDIDKKVIQLAKILHKGINFKVGTFNDIKYEKIDCLIAVNFIHDISSEELSYFFNKMCIENNIKNIIVDSVDNKNYRYTHNFDEILPKCYKLKSFIQEKDKNNRKVLHYIKMEDKK